METLKNETTIKFLFKGKSMNSIVKYILMVLILLFKAYASEQNIRYLDDNYFNQVSIIIDKSRGTSIINSTFYSSISQIQINENLIEGFNSEEISSILESQSDNIITITIKFNEKLTTCEKIFKDLINIISIDFSKFDSSSIVNIKEMFHGCLNLKSINLENFNTSSAQNMRYLFKNCSSLVSLDLSSFDTSSVTNMTYMFYGCRKLESLNIKSFDTSKVINMTHMFTNCDSLESIDLSNFNTSSVLDMYYIFGNCASLKSLDLSNFDTSRVTSTSYMFLGCVSLESLNLTKLFKTNSVLDMIKMFEHCDILTSLNLENFDTSNVKYFDYMFYYCKSLINLDLSHFNTSKGRVMKHMFHGCYELLSLNIHNFDTSNVKEMKEMFKHCNKLISLDLQNFNTSSLKDYDNIFNNVRTGLIYCISETKEYKFRSNLEEKGTNNCNDLCFTNSAHKIIEPKKVCAESCFYEDHNYIELNNICYDNCPNNTYILDNHCEKKYMVYNTDQYYQNIPDGYYVMNEELKIIGRCNLKCNNCNKESNNINLCISCNTDNFYYPKYNDSNNNDNYKDCYNSESITYGYYLDIINNVYKPCYHTCKSCNELGTISNQKCASCYPNFELNNNNCYPICDSYHYFDNNGEFICTSTNSCQGIFNKLIVEKNLCVNSCEQDDIYPIEYENQCYEQCPGTSKLINIKKKCIDFCENDDEYKLEYNNSCYKQCPENTKQIEEQKKCVDSCENNEYNLEYNNFCYKQCPENTKLMISINRCVDSCDGKFEYNKTCYDQCPYSTKLIYNTNQCVESCDNKFEYNNTCYDECPTDTKLMSNTNQCIDSCDGKFEYGDTCYEQCPTNVKLMSNTNQCKESCDGFFEYNNTCYEQCPFDTKLMMNTNQCVELCNNKYEYNNTCYDQCPFSTKLMININQCVESCGSKFEYNNSCYEQCPGQTKLIESTNLCVESCDGTYEYQSICYYQCPSNTKLLANKYECIDSCNGKFEYNNTCYEECPENTKLLVTTNQCLESCDGKFEYNNSCYYDCPINTKAMINSNQCTESCTGKFEYNDICYDQCPTDKKLIDNTNQCVDSCDGKFEYEDTCYQQCPTNTKLMANTNQCVESCTGKYEYNNTCYEECPTNTKLMIDSNQCFDSCENRFEYNNTCYEQCPTNTKLISNSNLCVESCDGKFEYNNTCYDQCPSNTKLIVNSNQCIESCANENIYKYEFNSTCYDNCPYDTKLISNTTQCIESCINDNRYKIEYNNTCYEECPNDLKFINRSNTCIDSCENDNIYKFEYNKICYEICPDNTKLKHKTNICVDSCFGDYRFIYNNTCYEICPNNTSPEESTNICKDVEPIDLSDKYEYHNSYYDQCPVDTKIIEEKKKCVDDCKIDDRFVYEYHRNKCYEICPNNTYFYNEDKYCYDNIPDGFYCNDTQFNTLDKCHENCKECYGPPSNNNNNCSKCPNDKNIYFDLGNCTDSCVNGFYNDINSNKICKCTFDIKCETCSLNSKELNLCTNCNKVQGYYQKEDFVSLENSFVDCFKDPEGYFLNLINELYERCYDTCKFCVSKGDENDNKCLECLEPYKFIDDFENKKNCYIDCQYKYYYDEKDNNKYKCTLDENCPEEYSKYIVNKKRCIDNCQKDNIYKYEYKNKCYNNCPDGTYHSSNNTYLCQDNIESEKYINNSILLEKKLEFEGNNVSLDFINSLNKNYLDHVGNSSNVVSKSSNNDLNIYIYKNVDNLEEVDDEAPLIDFGDCYNKVKSHYNIKDDLIVTIINNETNREAYGKATNQYLFSFPDSGQFIDTTGICDENDKIIIKEDIKTLMEGIEPQKEEYIKFLTNQGINVFNLSDRFYNDICFYYESPNNKDVPLKDRIASFFPNLTLCDQGCENKGLDFERMKAKCECTFNNFLNNGLISDLSGTFLSEIISVLNSVNIKVLKCFTELFDKKRFTKAIGGFFILGLFSGQIIFIFIFLASKIFDIKKHIFSLSDSFFLYKTNNKPAPPKRKTDKPKTKTYVKKFTSEINNSSQNSRNFLKQGGTIKKDNNHNLLINKSGLTKKIQIKEKEKNGKSSYYPINTNSSKDNNKYYNQIKSYLNESFDENDFLDVLDKEKRTFCEYFIEKYKNNQIILNTFCVHEIFKPRTIKIIFFILTIELYLVVNALFYNEEYLSDLFNSNKKESFFSFVPRRISHFIYASAVNIIISFLIGLFYTEEDKLKRIFVRFYNDSLKIKHELVVTIKEIERRFKMFIIVSIVLSIFSFVYISCFNIVYPYIRIEWIVSSVFIFIVMQLVNMFIVFFECCLRFLAIQCNSEKLFKLSLIVD